MGLWCACWWQSSAQTAVRYSLKEREPIADPAGFASAIQSPSAAKLLSSPFVKQPPGGPSPQPTRSNPSARNLLAEHELAPKRSPALPAGGKQRVPIS